METIHPNNFKKLEILGRYLFPVADLNPKDIYILGKSKSHCRSFIQKLFHLKKPHFEFVEKYFNCVFSFVELTDDSSFRSIPQAETSYVILAHPDENTPFTPLVDYLNSHENMIEILWIVLDKLNRQTLDIFQGRSTINIKFVNSADFRKEFENTIEALKWGGLRMESFNHGEIPLLPIKHSHANKSKCTVSLIDGKSGKIVSALFNGRIDNDNNKYGCHLLGVGWDVLTDCLMIMVNWVSSKKKRMGLYFINIDQKELKKYYTGARNVLYPWETPNFSRSGSMIIPLTPYSMAEDGKLYSLQSRFNTTALYLDDESMKIQVEMDYFKRITIQQPVSVLSVHDISTGDLLSESQSNSGLLISISIYKNLIGLAYNNNIKNVQLELRVLQDINTEVGRMGSEIFKTRRSTVTQMFLGNDYLLVANQTYGCPSFLIISLKSLTLYAKIKFPIKSQVALFSYYHPDFPELLIFQANTGGLSFVYCFNIHERTIQWCYPVSSQDFNDTKKIYMKSCV